MRTRTTVVLLRSFVTLPLLLLFGAAGCSGDAAAPASADRASGRVAAHEDPALAEIVAIVGDYRLRAVAAGLDGDDVRRTVVDASDPQALSHRMGYTPEEIAARDARLRDAVEDLRLRYPDARGAAPGCEDCVVTGVEAFATWLDGEPTLESARIVFMCEILPLVVDILNCVEGTGFMSDAMFGCVQEALCRNCTGCPY